MARSFDGLITAMLPISVVDVTLTPPMSPARGLEGPPWAEMGGHIFASLPVLQSNGGTADSPDASQTDHAVFDEAQNTLAAMVDMTALAQMMADGTQIKQQELTPEFPEPEFTAPDNITPDFTSAEPTAPIILAGATTVSHGGEPSIAPSQAMATTPALMTAAVNAKMQEIADSGRQDKKSQGDGPRQPTVFEQDTLAPPAEGNLAQRSPHPVFNQDTPASAPPVPKKSNTSDTPVDPARHSTALDRVESAIALVAGDAKSDIPAPRGVAAAMQVQPPVPLDAPVAAWGEKLAAQIAGQFNAEGQTVEIRLTPETLGRLQLRVEMKDGSAVVHMLTETAETAQILRDNQTRLGEALQKMGLDLAGQTTQIVTRHDAAALAAQAAQSATPPTLLNLQAQSTSAGLGQGTGQGADQGTSQGAGQGGDQGLDQGRQDGQKPGSETRGRAMSAPHAPSNTHPNTRMNIDLMA